ncbi:MAG: flagellar assembly protein FliH [Desulfovibrio sp.]|jgi:flagellar assembly protein FliH|nr:flagellar assembly protein FliH [Desulfovibrio sp.]
MSLSDAGEKRADAWGTIYSRGDEYGLGSFERGRTTAWNDKDETEYLARVRRKAEAMAADILSAAASEAAELRAEAEKTGYAAGMARASEELEEFRAGTSESLAAVLGAIEGQCSHIFEQQRDDITAVARLAVERITALELSERRAAVLTALLDEAAALLEKRRTLVIHVSAEDAPVLEDIIASAGERFPDVASWRVRADPAITPGGMLVESESSLADGRLESRIAAVDEVLKDLSLAENFGQDAGFTDTARATGGAHPARPSPDNAGQGPDARPA